jgi:hypothetical protein
MMKTMSSDNIGKTAPLLYDLMAQVVKNDSVLTTENETGSQIPLLTDHYSSVVFHYFVLQNFG